MGNRTNLIIMVICILGIFFGLLGIATSIQTTEALVMNGGQTDFYFGNLTVLAQPYYLLTMRLSAQQGAAYMSGWIAEILFLYGSIIGVRRLIGALRENSGTQSARIFATLLLIIVVVNIVIDYTYGAIGGGVLGHLLFAVCTSAAATFLLPLGVYFLLETYEGA